MRPDVLHPLFTDTIQLKGVGKRLKSVLKNLAGENIIDLVWHLPIGCVDRTYMPDLFAAQDGVVITSVVEVEEYAPSPPRSKRPFKVICKNETGYLTLVFFNANEQYLVPQLPLGQQRVVSGKVEHFDGMLQMVHPDYIVPLSELARVCRIEPTYPLTHGITQKTLGKIMEFALEKVPDLPEWLETHFFEKQQWKDWKMSLWHLHHPDSLQALDPQSPARKRLAYDELLAHQLALALTRGKVKRQSGRVSEGDGSYRKMLLQALPFKLTGDQEKVLVDILQDMGGQSRMVRLLQGDVGSGKTVVALLAMLNAVESGRQAALMAPTDILSRQHMVWVEKVIQDAGLQEKVKVTLLTGRDKGKKREAILQGLGEGSIHIVIGTHALFQEKVTFHDLALVVIDEQHRFGVKQRLSLSAKGEHTDILLMTATPIPRTLTLTLYGDMDISLLQEKPAGRKPIDTRTVPQSRMTEVVEGLKRVIAEGNRVYWVCPLIEVSEENDVAAAEARYDYLRKIYGDRVGLVHGRVKGETKDKVMQAFKEGALDILVATTVIEVGVDVPEAAVMVIEHAERFGLAQLHQLRGRVGRDTRQSNCILLYDTPISDIAKRRLKIMRETEDGFRIAEEDLVLRGSGEILGTRQSGMPEFKVALLPEHGELLLAARDDTKLIMETDPKLETERGSHLKTLLYLFEYDAQIKYLMSG